MGGVFQDRLFIGGTIIQCASSLTKPNGKKRCDVFAGRHFTAPDKREHYPEPRFITVGKLQGRMVVMIWTPRGAARRIISMRKANEREQTRYAHTLD